VVEIPCGFKSRPSHHRESDILPAMAAYQYGARLWIFMLPRDFRQPSGEWTNRARIGS
jgi:hypothetical protein